MVNIFVVTLATDDPISPVIEKTITGDNLEVMIHSEGFSYSNSLVISERDAGDALIAKGIFPRKRVISVVAEEPVKCCNGVDAVREELIHLDLREQLADLSHDIWTSWMEWQFSVCEQGDKDNSLRIPADKVTRWARQIRTPYSELSEQEKDSDREQADKILAVLEKR